MVANFLKRLASALTSLMQCQQKSEKNSDSACPTGSVQTADQSQSSHLTNKPFASTSPSSPTPDSTSNKVKPLHTGYVTPVSNTNYGGKDVPLEPYGFPSLRELPPLSSAEKMPLSGSSSPYPEKTESISRSLLTDLSDEYQRQKLQGFLAGVDRTGSARHFAFHPSFFQCFAVRDTKTGALSIEVYPSGKLRQPLYTLEISRITRHYQGH